MQRSRTEILYSLGVSVEAYMTLPDGFSWARAYLTDNHSRMRALEFWDTGSDSCVLLFANDAEASAALVAAPNVTCVVTSKRLDRLNCRDLHHLVVKP